ncbi:MAG: hypothetical protein ABF755_01115 [Oenococcus oeni]|uniref:hypothetical protein n=1 Tax=Oenococcus oeni TaxID=1247 RepID=UPI0008F92478|nr:hypothetical protein [Oenococcus oeni]OIM22421.1 hypothetical protein ATX60_09595 [Oenococcus oeni]
METFFKDALTFLGVILAAYITAKITSSLKNEPAFADKVIQQTDTIVDLQENVSKLKGKQSEAEEQHAKDTELIKKLLDQNQENQKLIKTLQDQNKILKKQNRLLFDYAKRNGFPLDDILAGKAS